MKILLILNGYIADLTLVEKEARDSDMVICADGGAKHAYDANIPIDVLLGDMDSLSTDILDAVIASGAKIIKLPAEKDETDGYAALQLAINQGGNSINILGALGGRYDHEYANMMLLVTALKVNINAKIIFEDGYIIACKSDTHLNLEIGSTLSILPIGGDLVIDKTKGLKYEINKKTNFPINFPLGISNIICSEDVFISIKSGYAILFYYKNKK